MKYYKIIKDNSFIGVIYSGQFVAQGKNTNKLFYANEITGQFVNYNGILYRDYWMIPIINSPYSFEIAEITEITEEEYNTLKAAIDNDEEIIIDDDEEEEEIIPVIEEDDLDEVKEAMREYKLRAMSYTCRTTIEAGFDTIIRGESKHFSLTTQDQLNLMSLSTMAQTQTLIPYHADGEECTFYTAEEINQIIDAANSFKNYQIAYHNALKAYINDLDTIEDIAAIEYGTPIPDEYKSDVLKILE